MGTKRLTLLNFIDEVGIIPFAEKLDVHPSTVSHWRNCRVLPKAEQMLAIKEMSKGALTPDMMIEDYFKDDANRGKHSK